MTREAGLVTPADIKRRKKWEDHVAICKERNCNICEPHLWIKIEEVKKWAIKNSQETRFHQRHIFTKSVEDLLDFLQR